ncbi:MAG: hypothetical protein A2857_07130 [Candidatus Levybacteria bacterium RIFCSPHIGHO2_01_FULL_36_15]|nr:MAG: hypothetical protein A2857_07130 [Candidatus Levybacteria bacterium RIFCSPHIGHO2_01_FULL_36_15]OGH38382.1 MAG: hypothetical protein A2905_00345 [Candidatus Levybacteria bacterium RIFCSPLOWO2_01_FULL_36_10]
MKIDIKHVAKLANLKLNPDEEKKFEKQLSDILNYIDKLNEVDTKNVEPTAQVTGLVNVGRTDDQTQPCLNAQEALKNAKSQHNGLFKVKAILEKE